MHTEIFNQINWLHVLVGALGILFSWRNMVFIPVPEIMGKTE